MSAHEAMPGSDIKFSCGPHLGQASLSRLLSRSNELTPQTLMERCRAIQNDVDALGDPSGSNVARQALSNFRRFAAADTTGSIALFEVPNWAWVLPATTKLVEQIRLSLLGISSSDMQTLRRDTGPEAAYGIRMEKGEIGPDNPIFLLEQQTAETPTSTRQLVVIDGREANKEIVLSYANTYSWNERYRAGLVLAGHVPDPAEINDLIGRGWADRWKAPDTASLFAAVTDFRHGAQAPAEPGVAYFDRCATMPL